MVKKPGQADAPHYEVTTSMVDAGLSVLWMNAEFHPAVDERELVGRLFLAMEKARSFQES
jgi:hypothetical protein